MPSVLSGDRLGYIDPHQYAFTASSHGINIGRRKDLMSTLPHQVEPFLDTFRCDSSTFRRGHYDGTLFRFPLRSRPSPLATEPYAESRLTELFSAFQRDAHLLPLFLRNVEKISLYERDAKSAGSSSSIGRGTPRLVFVVKIADVCIDEVGWIMPTISHFPSTHSSADHVVLI